MLSCCLESSSCLKPPPHHLLNIVIIIAIIAEAEEQKQGRLTFGWLPVLDQEQELIPFKRLIAMWTNNYDHSDNVDNIQMKCFHMEKDACSKDRIL